jgi:hypothetical protein
MSPSARTLLLANAATLAAAAVRSAERTGIVVD